MSHNKQITGIIQARCGSSRLPGKIMLDISGKPMLWHVINRIKHVKNIDNIVVATTNLTEDKQIILITEEMKVKCYTGSENDVLDRYYQTALKYGSDVIVRVTADCPLIDPAIIDNAIDYFLTHELDFVGNTINPTYPDGLDTWIFSFDALKKAWEQATLSSDREHVTTYIINNPHLFKTMNYENHTDLSEMRWTVDEQRDLQFVREVYSELFTSTNQIFYMKDVLELLDRRPDLKSFNSDIKRDEGYLKSLIEDSKTDKSICRKV